MSPSHVSGLARLYLHCRMVAAGLAAIGSTIDATEERALADCFIIIAKVASPILGIVARNDMALGWSALAAAEPGTVNGNENVLLESE